MTELYDTIIIGAGAAGIGGYTICTIAAIPSTTYTVVVGQAGSDSPSSACTVTTTGYKLLLYPI